MNAFYEHPHHNIKFAYRCFDRILLNGPIQPFQQPERVIGFFNADREGMRVTRHRLREIAQQFHYWVKNRAQKWGVPILEAPPKRRDEFVAPYFRRAKDDQVVVILKAREPARIMTAIGADERWHLQMAQRWVEQYNFYLRDRWWGRLFVRICPYLPFSARVCLNQHHWLAHKLRAAGLDFEQCSNAFLRCGDPAQLQELADSLTPHDLLTCGHKWLAALTPFFTESERKEAGCQHRLFFSQVEYGDNLIFHRRAALDQLHQRRLEANRSLGQPSKITTLFGRKVTKRYGGKLQTVIEDLELPNPVIRTHYANGFLKPYVRDRFCLRTESATNDVTDYGVKKAVENLPQLQEKLATICDNYLGVQQDILETFIDRGQLRQLTAPTFLSPGKRVPGLKLDDPRQLALLHALVRFANLAAGATFTTAELHPHALAARGLSAAQYKLASLRYDLGKLRAKGLVEKLPQSRRDRLAAKGYSICLLFLKLFERLYAPLTAGVLRPYRPDDQVEPAKRTELDRLYQRVVDDLDNLLRPVGLKAAA